MVRVRARVDRVSDVEGAETLPHRRAIETLVSPVVEVPPPVAPPIKPCPAFVAVNAFTCDARVKQHLAPMAVGDRRILVERAPYSVGLGFDFKAIVTDAVARPRLALAVMADHEGAIS